jgi:hypothetical protein
MRYRSLFVVAILTLVIYVALGVSIALAQPPTGVIVDGQGTATLSWQRPTQNTDGSPLPIEDIAGYTVHWGETSGNYDANSEITNGTVSSSMLDIALDGPTTIYFAMTATHVNGQVSALSNEVSKTFELEVTDDREPNPPELLDVALSITCETDTAGVSCEFTVQ